MKTEPEFSEDEEKIRVLFVLLALVVLGAGIVLLSL
jgi:hypothetical protein